MDGRFSLLQPVRLRLQVPLEGPYSHLLRRPAPEVEALGAGKCLAMVRTFRIRAAVPLASDQVFRYRAPGQRRWRLRPEDFQNSEWARQILEREKKSIELRYLAVPVGYVRLPNEPWISQLASLVTPWQREVFEGWRKGLARSLWLHVLRIYAFDPVAMDLPEGRGPELRVRPFRVKNLRPVLPDEVFASELDRLLAVLAQGQRREVEFMARSLVDRQDSRPAEVRAPYSLEEMAAETGFPPERLREWEAQLRRKQQIIFYGPPGTGKTFLAEKLGRLLTAGSQGFCELVQFHPSYAYEDFVQGIRPRLEQGGVVYELVPGRFLEFCRQARTVGEDPCVLIIDEINRAPLARVFGEVMYLLEYRERSIPLAAGGKPFQIPANVFLIGTMNTADRSIALVDQALRRRFAFVRLTPEYSILARFLEQRGYRPAELLAVLQEINRRIGNPDCELGISFFMSARGDLRQELSRIWKGEIEPYLEEVFYDRLEEVEEFRWDRLVADRLKEWRKEEG